MDDDDIGSDKNKEFLKNLLVAADRYDVQGLKFLCEKTLSGSLTIATVAAMFALADRHNCSKLHDSCVEFITGSDTLADVVETKGYHHLKSVLIDKGSSTLSSMGNIWSSTPTARMTSRSPPPARGVLTFEITGYSQHRGLGVGKFISSAGFGVGGYRWCIRCYPDGDSREKSKGHVGVYLELLSKNAKARAFYEFRLVDQVNDCNSTLVIGYTGKAPTLFSTRDGPDGSKNCFGMYRNESLEKTALEGSPYLKDDRIVIEFHITVIKEPCVVVKTSCSAAAAAALTTEPPHRPNLSHDFSRLLETKVGADVTFKVQGQDFAAHTSVVVARSPVLRELLSGQAREEQGADAHGHVAVNVRDMDPGVFEALLRFIYTDSVSATMAGLDTQQRSELCRSLLVAADRFDVKRLKFLCERTLSDGLDVDTVAAMLALAERHKCDALREACVEFIATTNRLHDVVATKEYAQLKASSPAVFVDLFEKAAGLR
nr:unnamed protein product [Digitaria exilis]